MRLPFQFGAILALVLMSACGGGGSPAPTTPGPSAAGPTPTEAASAIVCNASGSGTAVAIADFAFNPASANTSTNGFVTWSNGDPSTHTVTFDNGPDCGTIAGSASQTVQFTVAGSYAYHCHIHPSMKGTIVVN